MALTNPPSPNRSKVVTQEVDQEGNVYSSVNPYPSSVYYWNPGTLSYEVGTTGGSGVGTEVKVTNWPSVQVVSDGGGGRGRQAFRGHYPLIWNY